MNDPQSIDDEFYQLVLQGDPSNRLDDRLSRQIYVDKTLTSLYRRDDQHISLLMLASLCGHEQIVHILLQHSSNMRRMVELRGSVYRFDGKLVRNATALWCACDRGHYHVAQILIEIGGAKIEHGPKYPLLIDAVVNGRLDTVRFLLENRYAEIHWKDSSSSSPDSYKTNCLIMAIIRGKSTIVKYLLQQGCDLDQTRLEHTPLGYAVTRGYIDIVRLLCQYGANSKLKNRLGQSPLALAARDVRIDIIDYLFDFDDNLIELELTACALITPTHTNTIISNSQYQKMIRLMRKIFEIRSRKNLSKLILPAQLAYGNHQECQTIEEFHLIEDDHDRLFIETLFIRERLLHSIGDDSIFKTLLVFGDRLTRNGKFDRCIQLWTHTFHLYQKMNLDTGLHRFVWLLCRMITARVSISAEQFLSIAQLVFEPSQQKEKDDFLKNALCLMAISVKILAQPTLTNDDKTKIYQWIFRFCRQQRRTSSGQTLLHLAVDIQTYFDINYRAADIRPVLLFPNPTVTHLLLTYCSQWIDIDAIESNYGNTALHVSCRTDEVDAVVTTRLLIHANAHPDCLNKSRQTPLQIAQTRELKEMIQAAQSIPRLKCLCARKIVREQLPYATIWSKEEKLHTFIFLHGELCKKMLN